MSHSNKRARGLSTPADANTRAHIREHSTARPTAAVTRTATSAGIAVTLVVPPEAVDMLVELLTNAQAELVGDVTRKRYLTEEQIGSRYSVCARTVRDRLLPEGMPFHQVGDTRRYDPDETDKWFRDRRKQGSRTGSQS